MELALIGYKSPVNDINIGLNNSIVQLAEWNKFSSSMVQFETIKNV